MYRKVCIDNYVYTVYTCTYNYRQEKYLGKFREDKYRTEETSIQ